RAEAGLRQVAPLVAATTGRDATGMSARELVAATDTHVGDPDTVRESLAADTALARATHLSFQVHSVDPPHPEVLRSIVLVAEEVAPALGWSPAGALVDARCGRRAGGERCQPRLTGVGGQRRLTA